MVTYVHNNGKHDFENAEIGGIEFESEGEDDEITLDNLAPIDSADRGTNYINWMEEGVQLAHMGAHHTVDYGSGTETHNHWSLYTTDQTPVESTSPTWSKRLDVDLGDEFVQANWQNLSEYVIEHGDTTTFTTPGKYELKFLTSSVTQRLRAPDEEDVYIRLGNDVNGDETTFRYVGTNGQLQILDNSNNTFATWSQRFGWLSHHQNESRGVVWASDTTANRPATPVAGERFFDTDLGQPIWYDGTGWVDAQGTSV